jgi:hypothetical protein
MRQVCALLSLAALAGGCGASLGVTAPRPAPVTPAPPPTAPETPRFPALVVAAPRVALTTAGPQRVRLATPRARLPLRVVEARANGDLVIAITGGIEIQGVGPLDTLGVLVCEPGPVSERLYAGTSNLLRLRSALTGGRLKVSGEVTLREREPDEKVPFFLQSRVLTLEGEIDEKRLCTTPPQRKRPKEPVLVRTMGEVYDDDFPDDTRQVDVKKGEPLTLLARPGGTPLYTRPASHWGYSLVRLRTEAGWDLVAAGSGPYLVGWISTRPSREVFGPGGLGLVGGLVGRDQRIGPRSLHTPTLEKLPLHSLPAGTTLRQLGVVHARLTKPGFARVGSLRDGWRYVVAAVDDDVVVEGWVDPRQLGPEVQAAAP